jgi:hypothetical protein
MFAYSLIQQVAEFLRPTLDSQGIGSVRQGRYRPRDAVWMSEYDPLYVMLRSVKRREFQESFDRWIIWIWVFFCFVCPYIGKRKISAFEFHFRLSLFSDQPKDQTRLFLEKWKSDFFTFFTFTFAFEK